jgi:1,4-dihydroxy-2-naphthoyl-CoA hydrolase
MLWTHPKPLEALQARSQGTAVSNLGIEYCHMDDSSLSARMPVDARTCQPFGILHGGASVLLAETLGSSAASMCLDLTTHYCVGLDINANHIRGVKGGFVIGTARPIHVGRSTHVWGIEIRDEAERLVCIARLTMAVLPRDASEQKS